MNDHKAWSPAKVRHRIATDLTEIVHLYLDLWAEAVSLAADREMPGGDAMNLLGPAANLEAWQHRYEAAEARAAASDAKFPAYVQDQIDTEGHPLIVLAGWEDVIRDQRGQVTSNAATVPTAAAYLRDNIDWMLRLDDYGNQAWIAVDEVQRDLARVRSTLEAVLYAGDRPDRGADCLQCGTALIREWAHGTPERPTTEHDDHWTCITCGHRLTFQAYQLAIRGEYLARATWLQADHMLEQYQIPIGTLQGWAGKGIVRKRRNVHTGRMVYSVLDALGRRDGQEAA